MVHLDHDRWKPSRAGLRLLQCIGKCMLTEQVKMMRG